MRYSLEAIGRVTMINSNKALPQSIFIELALILGVKLLP